MYNLIEEFEEWVTADKKVHISIDNSIDFFEKFSIDKDAIWGQVPNCKTCISTTASPGSLFPKRGKSYKFYLLI